MATSAQQATYAASKGKNWADPTDPNFGTAGYIGQDDYNGYQSQGTPPAAPVPPAPGAPTVAKPIDLGPLGVGPDGTVSHQPPPAAPAPAPSASPPGAPPDPFTAMGGGAYLGNGQWVPKNSPLAASAAPTPSSQPMGSPAVPGATPPPPGAGVGPSQDFLSSLLGLLHPGAVDQNNPAISGAIGANNLQLQRGAEQQRADLAERSAAEGTNNSGGFDSRVQGIAEDQAARSGQFAGNEVQHLSDQQHQDTLSALGLLGGYLPEEQRIGNQAGQFGQNLEEQKREADIDSTLKRLGITTQGGLGQQDLALRDKLGSGQLGLGLLGALLQNQQFGQGLGERQGEFGAGLDEQTLLGLLGHLGA